MSNLFDNDTVSGNESFPPPLEAGKHRYLITAGRQSAKDGVPTGITFNFKHVATNRTHSHLYAIFAAGDRGRIAKGDMKALWDACKLEGAPGLDRIPNFVGKTVEINAIHTTPNDEGVFFANIRGTWAGDGAPATHSAQASAQAPAQPASAPSAALHPEDDKLPEDAPAAPTPEAAATSAAPAKSWRDRRKAS